MMLRSLLLVGTGSFAGGILRYLLSLWLKPQSEHFPLGTLAANLAGCLLIGLFYGISARNSSFSREWLLLLTTDLLHIFQRGPCAAARRQPFDLCLLPVCQPGGRAARRTAGLPPGWLGNGTIAKKIHLEEKNWGLVQLSRFLCRLTRRKTVRNRKSIKQRN